MKPTLHSQAHEWRDRDEENRVRIVRAEWDGRQWNFRVTLKTEPDWHVIEKPTLDMLEALRDVLWRKYQRRRVPFKFVQRVDAILEDMGVKVPDAEDGASPEDEED